MAQSQDKYSVFLTMSLLRCSTVRAAGLNSLFHLIHLVDFSCASQFASAFPTLLLVLPYFRTLNSGSIPVRFIVSHYTRSSSVLRLPCLARCGIWNFVRDVGVVYRITRSLQYLCINLFIFMRCNVWTCSINQTNHVLTKENPAVTSLPNM